MIHVHSFTFNPFQENMYLVYTDSGACMVIDPGCYTKEEERELQDYISENSLKPLLLLNTHCHIDHVFGNDFVGEQYGLRPHIHPSEQSVFDTVNQVAAMYGLSYKGSPDPLYYEGNQIKLEDEIFEILFVPGHAPGHIALYHKESGQLFSGDVLFRESIGRTDLPGGDMKTLLNSIRSRLFVLPDNTKVHPGHMGPTTIGYEKKHNMFLR